MKSIKFTLLVLGLFFWSNGFGQCFNMTVTPFPSPTDQQCYSITISFPPTSSGTTVMISDGVHEEMYCTSGQPNSDHGGNSCSFVWCYDFAEPAPYPVTIACRSDGPKNNCLQYDSCIVIVGQ